MNPGPARYKLMCTPEKFEPPKPQDKQRKLEGLS